MGCDLCVYLPDSGGLDCPMAYSTFASVRNSIIALYLEKTGALSHTEDLSVSDEFSLMFGVVPQTVSDSISRALDSLNTEEAQSMKVFWEHSDCDGTYWYEDCANIAKGIKKILPMFDKDDHNKFQAKALMNMFKYAGKMKGVVEVC